jgi:predicted adenine nucleotide alpha hydrolase (AANH) superfamily ATPase
MPAILLHTCCAPCASHAVEELRRLAYRVTLCFVNANLAPADEYERRLAAARQLAEQVEAPLLVDPPDHAAWLSAMQGVEHEAEGGARCARCFRYALTRVQALAAAQGFEAFTTSLTISPHKRSSVIMAIGQELDPVRFLAIDFKKKDGFRRSTELAQRYGWYRQNYCGCEFSRRK